MKILIREQGNVMLNLSFNSNVSLNFAMALFLFDQWNCRILSRGGKNPCALVRPNGYPDRMSVVALIFVCSHAVLLDVEADLHQSLGEYTVCKGRPDG